jgi:hypothetical protein
MFLQWELSDCLVLSVYQTELDKVSGSVYECILGEKKAIKGNSEMLRLSKSKDAKS